jgi:hypothetical protein
MTPIDSQVLESFVPVYDVVPEKWEDARPFIVEQLKKIATAVNIREIGWHLDEELLSGKAFIPGINNVLDGQTSQQFRQVLRKVIDFGPLPAIIKAVPHGIVFDSNFTLIQMYAAATDPTNLIAFSPVYAPATVAASPFGVQMYMTSTDVIIQTNSNRSSYTRCFVVIEYMQEL